jgi:hypothetical protein
MLNMPERFIPEKYQKILRPGREFELGIFGTVRKDKNYERDMLNILSESVLKVAEGVLEGANIPKEIRKKGLKEIRHNKSQLIEIVKSYQKFDPTNPNADFLRELRLAIIDILKLKEEEMDKVKIYSALDTPLDAIGIDGFITLKINKREEIVTLDASLRGKEFGEADIIFGELPDPKENEEGYLKAIEEIAKKAVKIFKSREV